MNTKPQFHYFNSQKFGHVCLTFGGIKPLSSRYNFTALVTGVCMEVPVELYNQILRDETLKLVLENRTTVEPNDLFQALMGHIKSADFKVRYALVKPSKRV